jgi:hypothetical protein
MMKCRNCQGALEPLRRTGDLAFYFCRACKLPHDESARPLFDSRELRPQVNLLQKARDVVEATNPNAAPVAKTALEVMLLAAFQEVHFAGIKEGVLLAYSRDV